MVPSPRNTVFLVRAVKVHFTWNKKPIEGGKKHRKKEKKKKEYKQREKETVKRNFISDNNKRVVMSELLCRLPERLANSDQFDQILVRIAISSSGNSSLDYLQREQGLKVLHQMFSLVSLFPVLSWSLQSLPPSPVNRIRRRKRLFHLRIRNRAVKAA